MIRVLGGIILFLASVLFWQVVRAEEFLWDAPESYTNGQPLNPATDLRRYKLYMDGTALAFVEKPDSATAPPTTYKYVVPLGQHRFFVTAVDNMLRESEPSNTLIVDKGAAATPTAVPKSEPPTGLRTIE